MDRGVRKIALNEIQCALTIRAQNIKKKYINYSKMQIKQLWMLTMTTVSIIDGHAVLASDHVMG